MADEVETIIPPSIADYCTNIVRANHNVVSREAELGKVIVALSQRLCNSVVLVGEPGTGKTSTIHDLATTVAQGDVPDTLRGVSIWELHIPKLLIGSTLQGQKEEKFETVLNALGRKDLLFVDNIQDLIALGSEKGANLILAMLLQALNRPDVRIIGTATTDQWKALEANRAFTSKVQRISIEETTDAETTRILAQTSVSLATHHGVVIEPGIFSKVIILCKRYISSKLPLSAIALIDRAAAMVSMNLSSTPVPIRNLQMLLEAARAKGSDETVTLQQKVDEEVGLLTQERENIHKRKELLGEIETLSLDMARNTRTSNWGRVAQIKNGELPLIEATLKTLSREIDGARYAHDVLSERDIYAALSELTGIPVSKMTQSESEKLLKLEVILASKVVGQLEPVQRLAEAMRRARAGIQDPTKPLLTGLLLGTTGVGKTEITKALADTLFDGNIVRIDMSEYGQAHNVARLMGPPPGYTGYGEGGQLTEAVRQRPYTVVLLDEIEKAHTDVFNILLQLLDEGRLTDGQGRTVKFCNSVILLTSNLGAECITGTITEETKDKIRQRLLTRFKPEILNRLDEILYFERLTEDNVRSILLIMLRKLNDLLINSHNMKLELSDEAMALVAKAGFQPEMGARPLGRAVQQLIKTPLSTELLRGTFSSGDTIKCTVVDGQMVFSK